MMERNKGLGKLYEKAFSDRCVTVQNKKSCTCNSHPYIPVRNLKTELPKPTEFTPEFTEGQMFICSNQQDSPDMPK